MNSTEITIYFEEAKAAALKAVLAQEGSTIESKLQESLRFLYEQLVPVEQQSAIDALIKAQEEQERQEAEARKRFAVFHVRENGENSYFTSQHFTSFHAAGYRYRLYARGDLSSQPQNLADAFAGSEARKRNPLSSRPKRKRMLPCGRSTVRQRRCWIRTVRITIPTEP